MKYVLLLCILFPLKSFSQLFFSGETNGVKNKSFDIKDIRDFPDFSYLLKDGVLVYDTILNLKYKKSEIYKRVKGWAASSYNSLPDVLKLDDSSHIVIHAVSSGSKGVQVSYSLDLKFKDHKLKISMSDFKGHNPTMTLFSFLNDPVINCYYRYSTNNYKGGKKGIYRNKKYDMYMINSAIYAINESAGVLMNQLNSSDNW